MGGIVGDSQDWWTWALSSMAFGFGDLVRIRRTPVTEAAGVGGLQGTVFGHTMPSASEVPVIGDPGPDFAINVFFDERGEGFWFSPDLIEFVAHQPGMTVTFERSAKRLIQDANGNWKERGHAEEPSDTPLLQFFRWLEELFLPKGK